MTMDEFKIEMSRLCIAYGQRASADPQRFSVFLEQFRDEDFGSFKKAVTWVISNKPYFPTIFDLKEAIRKLFPPEPKILPEYPENPDAGILAKKYAPGIMSLIEKSGKSLPYDPSKRISNDHNTNLPTYKQIQDMHCGNSMEEWLARQQERVVREKKAAGRK